MRIAATAGGSIIPPLATGATPNLEPPEHMECASHGVTELGFKKLRHTIVGAHDCGDASAVET
jgi:hypothetical protein